MKVTVKNYTDIQKS